MGDIRVSFSALNSYGNSVGQLKSNFDGSVYGTFSSSYLRRCGEPVVSRMASKMEGLYRSISSNFSSIQGWMAAYTGNLQALEAALCGRGLGGITEGGLRGIVSAAVSKMAAKQKQIKNVFQGSNGLQNGFKAIGNTITGAVTTAFFKGSALKNQFGNQIKQWQSDCNGAWTSMKEWTGNSFKSFVTNVKNTGAEIKSQVTSKVTEVINNLPDPIKQGLNNTGRIIASLPEATAIAIDKLGGAINTGAATVVTGASSLVKGIGQLAEGIVDGLVLIGGGTVTLGARAVDGVAGLMGNDTNFAENIWNDVKGFTSTEYVNNAFSSMYNDTEFGDWLQNNSAMAVDGTAANVLSGIGYVGGIVGLSILTGGLAGGLIGAGSAGVAGVAGTATGVVGGFGANAGISAVIAGLSGFGQGTQNAWNDGASDEKGLLYGVLNGLKEGAQFYAGGKIASGAFGDWVPKAAANLMKTPGFRMIFDALDGATEGVLAPVLGTIYKDKNFFELFEENGGWKGVATGAAIGGGASFLGEAFDYLKFKGNTRVTVDANLSKPKPKGDLSIPEDFRINSSKYEPHITKDIKKPPSLLWEMEKGDDFVRNTNFDSSKYKNPIVNDSGYKYDPDFSTRFGNNQRTSVDDIVNSRDYQEYIFNRDHGRPVELGKMDYYDKIEDIYNKQIKTIDVQKKTEVFDQFESLMKDDNISNKEVVDFFQNTFDQAINKGNTEAIAILGIFNELKRANPDLSIEKSDLLSSWNKWDKTLKYNPNLLTNDVIAHELGHCMFDSLLDGKLPSNWDNVLGNTKKHITDNNSLMKKFEAELAESMDVSYREAKDQLERDLTSQGLTGKDYQNKLKQEFTDFASQPTDKIVQSMKDAGYRQDIIDEVIGDSLTDRVDKLTNYTIRKELDQRAEVIIGQNYSQERSISDIVDSIFHGKKTDLNGNSLDLPYGHSENYYNKKSSIGKTNTELHEMMANFTALKISTDPSGLMKLKSLIGEDMYQTLDNMFHKFKKETDFEFDPMKSYRDSDLTGKKIVYNDKEIDSKLSEKYNKMFVDEITEELPPITFDKKNFEIDITEELPPITFDKNKNDIFTIDPKKIDMNNYNTYLENVNYGQTLKEEIFTNIPNDVDIRTKMRSSYLQLSDKLSYDKDFFVTQNVDLYSNVNGFSDLVSNQVVCRSWADLYRETLVDIGIPPERIRIAGSGKHGWVEVDMGNTILFADATQAYGISAMNDFTRVKNGMKTVGFFEIPKSRYKEIGTGNPANLAVVSFGDDYTGRLLNMDEKLGYSKDSKYFDDTLKGIREEFSDSKLANEILGINSFDDQFNQYLSFDNTNLSIIERIAYLNITRPLFMDPDLAPRVRNLFMKKKFDEIHGGVIGIIDKIGNDASHQYYLYEEGKQAIKITSDSVRELVKNGWGSERQFPNLFL